MKKNQLVFLLILFCLNGFSQSNIFIIKVIDNKGLKDSVVMGEYDGATTGIDINLKESDYYGEPFTDLDVRSIQRNMVTRDNLWLIGGEVGGVEPFSGNIDLKKDIRSNNLWGQHFVLQIHAVNYPVKVIISYLNIGIDIPYCRYNGNIATGTEGELQRKKLIDKEDTIFIISSSAENKLIGFHPQNITNTIDQKNTSGLALYPIPSSNMLFIRYTFSADKYCIIYDCYGVEIERFQLMNNRKELNISNYKKGFYFLQVGGCVSKFIKK